MARGFESKDVEFQQAESERRSPTQRARSARERDRVSQRETIALSIAQATEHLRLAVNPAHRRMLQLAIDDLALQLSSVDRDTR
jgi:hypothetical protein